jgi:hypothetical protein
LELGCDNNKNFDNIALTDKTGVDIHSGGTIRCSTNDFFKICQRKFDLVFIDAYHESVQVYQDFENALTHLNDGGCIVFHDCLPKHEQFEVLTCNGDVWKAFVKVRQLDEVNAFVVNTAEGIGLAFKNPNTQKPQVTEELNFQNYLLYRDDWLRIVDVQQLLEMLPTPPNHKGIWITSYGEWGRIGHQFSDIISGLIISEIFGLHFHCSPFSHEQHDLNNHLNLQDFFDKHDLGNPVCIDCGTNNHTLQIFTRLNDAKWRGMSLSFLREHIRFLQNNTNLVFKHSTFFNLHNLWSAEQNCDVLPGTCEHIIKRLQNILPQTKLYNEFSSDFETELKVAAYVRAGGTIRDNIGREQTVEEYEQIIDRIKTDYPGRRLNIIFYTQGPLSDLVGDFSKYRIEICDDKLPRLYEIMKTFFIADIFIAGVSGFSTMIAAFRAKPTYWLQRNPFALRTSMNIMV